MDPMETTSTPTPPPVTTPPPTEPTPPPSQTQQAVPPPSTISSATETPSSTSSQNAKPNAIPTQQSSSNPNPQSSTIPIQQQPQTQPQPQPTLQQAQARPQLNRVQPPPAYSQYSQHISSLPPSTSTSLSSPATTTSIQRGGLAIGVPAHQQRPPSQPAPFSTYGQSSFSQQYGGVGRNPISVSDTSNTQARQPIQGMHTIGNFGSLMGSQLRPGGVSSQNQPRALQPSMRPQATPTNHSSPNQSFQSHALLRTPAMGSPSTPSPATPQGLQTHTQPWMTAAAQGKQMHPSYRPPIRPQNLQQRSHQPQQHHHPMSTVAQQAAYSQQQQQPMSQLHKPQDHYGPQHTLTRVPQSMPHQQQAQRGLGSGNPKTPTTTAQASALKSAPPNTTSDVDAGESSNHILSKRSIHELVSQIDPSEELDPEVEDILIEIAEDFVDSITSVGCSMAKHRKSTTLEAKDILLHLERNWNMTLPGFGGDEIKGYKKQLTNDIHKERLAMVKKSMVGPDAVNVKSSGGQAAGNPKARENA